MNEHQQILSDEIDEMQDLVRFMLQTLHEKKAEIPARQMMMMLAHLNGTCMAAISADTGADYDTIRNFIVGDEKISFEATLQSMKGTEQ